MPLGLTPEVGLLFFGTVCYYNLHKLTYSVTTLNPLKWSANVWMDGLSQADRSITLLSGLSLLFILVENLRNISWLWFVLPFFPLFYSLPVVTLRKQAVRFRELPLIKLLTISLSYGIATVLLPLVSNGMKILLPSVLIYGLFSFVLIASLCVPFEIRDEQKEIKRNVPTLMRYGFKRVRYTTLVVLTVMSVIIMYAWNSRILPGPVCLAMVFTLGISASWVLKANSRWPNWYFKLGVDGTMVLHLFFLILFKLWQ